MTIGLTQQTDAIEAAILGLKHWCEIKEGRPERERKQWEHSIKATRDRIADFEAVATTLRWLQANDQRIKNALRGE